MTAIGTDTAIGGLSAGEVAQRVAAGRVNDVPDAPTRTAEEIVKANVFTRFNALLSVLLVIILVVGPAQDALFGFVLVGNTLVGIVQELRAKRTLDRLAVLNAPKARVVRDGAVREIGVGEVVLDDVLELHPGDQVVVDAVVLEARGLELDESLLTGESDTVPKQPNDEVLSGSFVAAGRGHVRANRVGREAYATRLAEQARRFTLIRSELRTGIDKIITFAAYGMVPTAVLLIISQLRAADSVREALRSTVGGVVAMVPEGLVLLTSVAFAVAIVRLGRKRILVQELPAVEILARVDVLCLDKTGTLTEGEIDVVSVETVGTHDVRNALGAIATIEADPNATLRAIATAFVPPDEWQTTATVPFSSARKWSAATFAQRGTWVLGAPEILLASMTAPPEAAPGTPGDPATIAAAVDRHAGAGNRVVLLACTDTLLPPEAQALPGGLQPAALVVLEDRVRPDAAEILGYFVEQGVNLKVISGDHPATVAAVARRAGVPDADDPIDARTLPEDPAALGLALEAGTVFGRVLPHQKQAMVGALQQRGHVVAMTGDGVNDVLALKDSDIGIAMGSGSPASRAVAQLVLLDNEFAHLPVAVAEGRRVINNIERVAGLFVTKTVYSMLIALGVGVASLQFPFLPRHITLVGTLSIGVPGFFLALLPNNRRASSGFVRRVLRFAIPSGAIAAIATFTAYALAELEDGVSLTEARTTATLTLVAMGLIVLGRLARPLTPFKRILIAAMGSVFLLVTLVPSLRRFYDLDIPPRIVVFAAIGLVGLAAHALELTSRFSEWTQHRRRVPEQPDEAD